MAYNKNPIYGSKLKWEVAGATTRCRGCDAKILPKDNRLSIEGGYNATNSYLCENCFKVAAALYTEYTKD